MRILRLDIGPIQSDDHNQYSVLLEDTVFDFHFVSKLEPNWSSTRSYIVDIGSVSLSCNLVDDEYVSAL